MSGTRRNDLLQDGYSSSQGGTFGAFAAGIRLADNMRASDQRFGVQQREIEDEEALREATPGILSGDVDATQRAMAINPQRVDRVRGVVNAQEDRQRGEQEVGLQRLGRGVTSLLAVDESQWPTVYPRIRQDLAQFGFNLPEAVPSRDQVMSIGAALRTPAQNMADDADRPRLGPPIGAAPGAAAMPAGAPVAPVGGIAAGAGTDAVRQGNAQAAAMREAVMNDPNLTPAQVQERLAQISAGRAQSLGQPAVNPATAGAGAPVPNWDAGIAAPSGRVNPNVGGVASPVQRASADGGLPPGARPLTDRNGIPLTRGNQMLVQMPDGRRAFVPMERAPTAATQPTYNTVQTEEGVFAVNSRDPNDRVRIGNRPPSASQAREGRLTGPLIRDEATDLEKIQVSASIERDMAAFRREIDAGVLALGPLANTVGRVRNFIGQSGEESRRLALFEATLERMRNESLRLNAGVQTEGDSQRAWQELVRNINDPGVVRDQLTRIEEINSRAVQLRRQLINHRRQLAGVAPLGESDAGVSGVQPAVGSPAQPRPAAQGPPRVTNDAEFDALPSGATFIDPEGRTRRKP